MADLEVGREERGTRGLSCGHHGQAGDPGLCGAGQGRAGQECSQIAGRLRPAAERRMAAQWRCTPTPTPPTKVCKKTEAAAKAAELANMRAFKAQLDEQIADNQVRLFRLLVCARRCLGAAFGSSILEASRRPTTALPHHRPRLCWWTPWLPEGTCFTHLARCTPHSCRPAAVWFA
jgi:hypothetical protein